MGSATVLAGLSGRFTAGCVELRWVVILGVGDKRDRMVELLAGDDPRTNDSLDLEGPNLAATTPCLSKNFLNSYLARGFPSEYWRPG